MVINFGEFALDTDSMTTSEIQAVQGLTERLSGVPTPWLALNPFLRFEDAVAIVTVLLARHVGAEDATELVAALSFAEWRAMFASVIEGADDGDS